jgi:hypothetical protein
MTFTRPMPSGSLLFVTMPTTTPGIRLCRGGIFPKKRSSNVRSWLSSLIGTSRKVGWAPP